MRKIFLGDEGGQFVTHRLICHDDLAPCPANDLVFSVECLVFSV